MVSLNWNTKTILLSHCFCIPFDPFETNLLHQRSAHHLKMVEYKNDKKDICMDF